MSTCAHLNFNADVRVARLTDSDDGPVTGYTADVEIKCVDCGVPMMFVGMEPGSSPAGPRCRIDGTEARLPITPSGTRPSPLQQMVYGVRRFDS